MKYSKLISSSIIIASLAAFTGCSWDNPFGVGYEHSACESSSNFGVCGSPEFIYKYRDTIRDVQRDYLKSGIDDELFFGITETGAMLVKPGRTDKWLPYEGSSYEKRIKESIESKEGSSKELRNSKKATGTLDYNSADIPVTQENDLSVRYASQGRIIQTRTNVGDMIRDNGLIQKVWIAPVVDQKGDLISAHELFVVIKDPQWLVGESTPKAVKGNTINIPTPMSRDILQKQEERNDHEENVIGFYNTDRKGQLVEEISKDSEINSKDEESSLRKIENFIKE